MHKSRQGRLNPCQIGQSSFPDLSCCGRWFPTFRRWPIIASPSGPKAWTGFAGVLGNDILLALDRRSAPHLNCYSSVLTFAGTSPTLFDMKPLRWDRDREEKFQTVPEGYAAVKIYRRQANQRTLSPLLLKLPSLSYK